MTTKSTGRTGWHQTTHKASRNKDKSIRLAEPIEAVIVKPALWRVLPGSLAVWMIKLGGLRDV